MNLRHHPWFDAFVAALRAPQRIWRGSAEPSGLDAAAQPRAAYKPHNVGNDASARPWERDLPATPTYPQRLRAAPEGFDSEAFLAQARQQFAAVQAAWESGDVTRLRSITTEALFAQLQQQPGAAHSCGDAPCTTALETLRARLLGVEQQADGLWLASVEFSGMDCAMQAFCEVWNMRQSADESARWLVAGLQALQ